MNDIKDALAKDLGEADQRLADAINAALEQRAKDGETARAKFRCVYDQRMAMLAGAIPVAEQETAEPVPADPEPRQRLPDAISLEGLEAKMRELNEATDETGAQS